MKEKIPAILQAWLSYIRLEEEQREVVTSAQTNGVSLEDDRLKLTEPLFDELQQQYRDDEKKEFARSLAFPQVFRVERGEQNLFPLFSINITSIFVGPYQPDGWDLKEFDVQPSLKNLMNMLNWSEEQLDQLVTQQGVHTFLLSTFGREFPTLQKFMTSFAPPPFRTLAEPYIFEPTGGNYTRNLKRDLQDLMAGLDTWYKEGRPAHDYLFGAPPAPRHEVMYLGAFPTYPPSDSQASALKHAKQHILTAVQGPPGSGKTTLILHVIAQQIVQRALNLAEGLPDKHNLTIITSTNNRAVHNVVERLETADALSPFWLVGGNSVLVNEHALPRLEQRISDLELAEADESLWAQLKSELLAVASRLRKKENDHRLASRIRSADKERAQTLRVKKEELEAETLALGKLIAEAKKNLDACSAYATFPTAPYRRVKVSVDATWLQLDEQVSWHIEIWRNLTGKGKRMLLAALAGQIHSDMQATLSTPFPLSVPMDRSSLSSLREVVTKRLSAAERYASLHQHLTKLESDLFQKANDLNAIQAESDEIAQRLAIELPDFYGQFYKSDHDHPEHQQLFRLSVNFLHQEALRRKKNVLNALETYADLLRSREDSMGKNVWSRKCENLVASLSDLTLVFPVITCALPSVRRMMPAISPGCVDRIIVDEAGMIPLHQLFPLLVRGRRTIIVGDPLQIEPVITMARDTRERYETEAFTECGLSEEDFRRYSPTETNSATAYHRAAGAKDGDIGEGILLREHQRCQPPIASFFNNLCKYNFTIQTEKKDPPLGSNLIAYHVEGHMKDQVNVDELDAVEAIVAHLIDKGYRIKEDNDKDSKGKGTIGVISPFRAHASALSRRLNTRWNDFRNQDAVGTIHTFQGGEKSVILFSTRVCQSGEKGLNFINSRPNLLNVAVSRAKDLFILVGNLHVLKKAGGPTGKLVEHIENQGVVLEFGSASDSVPAEGTIRDCEHIRELHRALDAAKEELILVCPWIRGKAAEDFANRVESTLERGVAVIVLYGYQGDKDQDPAMVKRLQVLFAKYPHAHLQLLQNGTHEKCLVCDSTYAIVGSWNWLSHWYGGACQKQQMNAQVQVRHETSLRITDTQQLHQLRQGIVDRLKCEVPHATRVVTSTSPTDSGRR